MNYKLFEELNDIDSNKITNYFESYCIEPEYFSCRKEGLISLENYLVELKNKKEEYDNVTKDIITSIKEKDYAITRIEPFFDVNTNNDFIIFKQDNLVSSSKHIYYYDIKKELKELIDIISNFDYTKERNGFISSSNNFMINPVCFSLIQVLLKDKTLLAKLQLQDDNYEVKKFDTRYVKRYNKENIKRIYLSK